MKLSDLLRQGSEILKQHGDLDVQVTIAEYYEGETSLAQKLTVREAHHFEASSTRLLVEFE